MLKATNLPLSHGSSHLTRQYAPEVPRRSLPLMWQRSRLRCLRTRHILLPRQKQKPQGNGSSIQQCRAGHGWSGLFCCEGARGATRWQPGPAPWLSPRRPWDPNRVTPRTCRLGMWPPVFKAGTCPSEPPCRELSLFSRSRWPQACVSSHSDGIKGSTHKTHHVTEPHRKASSARDF